MKKPQSMRRFMLQSHTDDGAAGMRTKVPGSEMNAISKGVTTMTKRMLNYSTTRGPTVVH